MPSTTEFLPSQRFVQKFRSVETESTHCVSRYAKDCAKVFNSFEKSTIQIRSFSIYTFVAATLEENRDTIL
jgi:hypothetical protein